MKTAVSVTSVKWLSDVIAIVVTLLELKVKVNSSFPVSQFQTLMELIMELILVTNAETRALVNQSVKS